MKWEKGGKKQEGNCFHCGQSNYWVGEFTVLLEVEDPQTNIGNINEYKDCTKDGHMLLQNFVSEVHGRLDPNHVYLGIFQTFHQLFNSNHLKNICSGDNWFSVHFNAAHHPPA